MKEIGRIIILMVMECINFRMVVIIKDNGVMVKNMDRVFIIIVMEILIKDNFQED